MTSGNEGWTIATRQGAFALCSGGRLSITSYYKAIVAVLLACEIPCGGARYVGSGLSKYDTGKMIIGKLSEFIGILTANCCTAILRPFQRCFWS